MGICGSICKNRKEMPKIDYDKLEKYDEIYTIYDEYNKKIKEFSLMSWSKLDASLLL